MKRSRILFILTVGLHVGGASDASSQDLGKELADLNLMRKGANTDLAAVDRQGSELLGKYADPKDRGQIYYELAIIHSQSGMKAPRQVAEYAKNALACPLDSLQKEQLYVFWGDALQVAESSKSLPERRSEAVVPYMEGLKALLPYSLPDTAPDVPPVFTFDAGPQGSPVYEALKRKHDEAWAAHEAAILQGKMIRQRDILIGQIAGLYGRRPYAREEVEQLARQSLNDSALVDKLMAAVDAEVKADLARNPEVKPPPPPSGISSAWLRWTLTIGSLVVILAALGVFWFLRIRKRFRAAGKRPA